MITWIKWNIILSNMNSKNINELLIYSTVKLQNLEHQTLGKPHTYQKSQTQTRNINWIIDTFNVSSAPCVSEVLRF